MQDTINKKISRRDFMTLLWGLVTLFPFLYSAFRFMLPPSKRFNSRSLRDKGTNYSRIELDFNSFSEKPYKLVNIDDEPVIVVRKSATEFAAFSAICTHLNCTVGYRTENNDFYCSCHGGRFAIDGSVIEGPPKKPLIKYAASNSGNKVIITKPAEQ